MEDDDTKLTPLEFFGLVALTPFSLAWHGYALTVLWRWFLEPMGYPEMGLVSGAGIFVILALIKSGGKEKSRSEYPAMILGSALKPAVALFFGWLVHLAGGLT